MIDVTGIVYKVDDDKWYRHKGVAPPSRQAHGVSEDNIEEIIRANGNHTCKWYQQGPYIKCTEGPNEHGKNIGTMQRLQGTDKDGSPILIKL